MDLPKTHFQLEAGNPVEQIFWGRVRIEQATSYFYYSKGSRYQRLIHDMKYQGKKWIGYELGKKMGTDLLETHYAEAHKIVPVPLHPKKLRKRGYNQSFWIAKGLSERLDIPVEPNNLYRKVNTRSQTKKSRFDRWQNLKNVFGVRVPDTFSYKHILLIDDIVTTGATLEACANSLAEIKGCRISILSLGYSTD
jgi:ComF family protein